MLTIETINTNDPIDHTDASRLRACESLTFPARRFILREPQDKVLVAAAAHFAKGGHTPQDPPAGFGLGWGGPNGEFELISVYTLPLLRGMGAGGRLLATLEDGFAELGYRRGFHFYTISDDDPAFTDFLTGRGWSPPVIREIICKSTLELAGETPWLMRARLADGFAVKPWGQVTESERAAIAARQQRDVGGKVNPGQLPHESWCGLNGAGKGLDVPPVDPGQEVSSLFEIVRVGGFHAGSGYSAQSWCHVHTTKINWLLSSPPLADVLVLTLREMCIK